MTRNRDPVCTTSPLRATTGAAIVWLSVALGAAAGCDRNPNPSEETGVTTPPAEAAPAAVEEAQSCPAGEHEGGGGVCVPSGECADGFTLDASGGCSGWLHLRQRLSRPRSMHTTTRLDDGRVLVAGGHRSGGGLHTQVDLFDPAQDSWSTAMAVVARNHHTATLLQDGQVLLLGGENMLNMPLNTAEIFHPDSDTFEVIDPMIVPRTSHSATLLTDGRVLVCGGDNDDARALAAVELFDPERSAFEIGPPLYTARHTHTATRLDDGRVLVAGGTDVHVNPTDQVEIYDPSTNAWAIAAPLPAARRAHAAVRLGDGRVLICGGEGREGYRTVAFADCYVYDPAVDAWSTVAPLSEPRHNLRAILLPDGRVLVTGGMNNDYRYIDRVEVFDPETGFWSDAPPMPQGLLGHGLTVLRDGSVLVTGGTTGSGVTDSAARFWVGAD